MKSKNVSFLKPNAIKMDDLTELSESYGLLVPDVLGILIYSSNDFSVIDRTDFKNLGFKGPDWGELINYVGPGVYATKIRAIVTEMLPNLLESYETPQDFVSLWLILEGNDKAKVADAAEEKCDIIVPSANLFQLNVFLNMSVGRKHFHDAVNKRIKKILDSRRNMLKSAADMGIIAK
jgi:hypothetical protein